MTSPAFPFAISAGGRTETVSGDEELAIMVLQVLRTALGSRINRPDFGSRLDQMVFASAGDQLAGAVEVLVRSALMQWLLDKIEVRTVDVAVDDAELIIRLVYSSLPERRTVVQTFSQSIGFG